MWSDSITDRRNSPRHPSGGVVVVRMRGCTLRGRIADLSASGVRARVETGVVFDGLAGRRVGIELHFDDRGAEWLYLRGRVVRVSPAFLTVGIAFDTVPTDFADMVAREGHHAVLH